MEKNIKSAFLKIMIERGFIHQMTDKEGLDSECYSSSITGYIGFDCTAPSLHVGSLIQIMMLRWFQKTGNKPIVLMGGGTTKIGDPSGKDAARPVLTSQIINDNKDSIKTIFEKFLNFGKEQNSALLIDNSIWLDKLNYISFLRDFGSSFSINKLINLDSVKIRLEREQNLSFLEFNYSLLQAFDFLKLNQEYNCQLQMGGSDQWGNIITGLDLVRKKNSRQAFGLTSPLLTTSSGAKMGKSANGAVWLNENQLSNWDFWQYWRNTEDLDVIKFLKLFTELPMQEIEKLEKLKGSEINEAKIILANEVTKLCRGEKEAERASNAAINTFSKLQNDDALPNKTILEAKISIIDALKVLDFVKSNGEARRLIRGNGARVNDIIINDEHFVLSNDHFKDYRAKISSGKKKHGLLVLKQI
jgi:tyrosyl-tRNA synthetase|tara:strand:+ start:918 stop:2165 length:1248 start_codon:yes stop_codon:yes gene_type:complete